MPSPRAKRAQPLALKALNAQVVVWRLDVFYIDPAHGERLAWAHQLFFPVAGVQAGMVDYG